MPFKNPHPLYNVWKSMIGRCRNPRFKQWADYGGRGISVCDEWKSPNGVGFRQFLKDMGPRPKHAVLDRTDNNLGYSPSNCQWVTKKESQRNQRRTIMVTIEGKQYKAIELAEKTGLKCDTIVARAKRGLTMRQMLNTKRRVFYPGLEVGWKYGRGAGNR